MLLIILPSLPCPQSWRSSWSCPQGSELLMSGHSRQPSEVESNRTAGERKKGRWDTVSKCWGRSNHQWCTSNRVAREYCSSITYTVLCMYCSNTGLLFPYLVSTVHFEFLGCQERTNYISVPFASCLVQSTQSVLRREKSQYSVVSVFCNTSGGNLNVAGHLLHLWLSAFPRPIVRGLHSIARAPLQRAVLTRGHSRDVSVCKEKAHWNSHCVRMAASANTLTCRLLHVLLPCSYRNGIQSRWEIVSAVSLSQLISARLDLVTRLRQSLF